MGSEEQEKQASPAPVAVTAPHAPVAAASKPVATSAATATAVPAPSSVPLPPAQPKVASQAAGKTAAKPDFELPSAVYSPQLLESVISDIQTYLEWYRQNQIRKRVGAKAEEEEPNHSDETVLVIESWLQGKPPTVSSLEELVNHLRDLSLPEVHIMLAALPNRAQRQQLVDWFRNNATPRMLISFVADRNLGGGLVVRTPNRVFDFTWKQQLLANRDKLAGVIKRV